mgnify:CR=1 FL=1
MNYRKMKWLLIPLIVMFVIWWITSVWMHTLKIGDDQDWVDALLSTGTGYNYMKSQVLFALIFVAMLFQLMPELALQQIIKTGRRKWILDRVRYIFISAMYFAAVFILVEVVLGIMHVGIDFLLKYNYFWCMLLGWLSLIFIYLFMGIIYLMFSVIFSPGLFAMGMSFLATLIFMVLSFYKYVPTVYLVMDIMQTPAMEKLGLRSNPMFVVKPLIYNTIAMVVMIIVSVQVFKRKDLLDSNLQFI